MFRKKDDEIRSRDRVMSALRATDPKALTAKAVQLSTQIYWEKLLSTLEELVKEKVIEKIDTSMDPVYRIRKK